MKGIRPFLSIIGLTLIGCVAVALIGHGPDSRLVAELDARRHLERDLLAELATCQGSHVPR